MVASRPSCALSTPALLDTLLSCPHSAVQPIAPRTYQPSLAISFHSDLIPSRVPSFQCKWSSSFRGFLSDQHILAKVLPTLPLRQYPVHSLLSSLAISEIRLK